MANGRVAGPRCVALVGPFASGKTTLLEAILARTGAITRQATITDTLTMAIPTMDIPTMRIPTMAIPTMAIPTMATLTITAMATRTAMFPKATSR